MSRDALWRGAPCRVAPQHNATLTMKVKNFNKFQHFKDRRPPWVKLYRDLLDDPEWFDLDPKAAKYLVLLWLIASEDEDRQGGLPDVKTLAFRLRLAESEASQVLNSLSHWLEQDDINLISDRYQPVSAAETTQTATETNRYQL